MAKEIERKFLVLSSGYRKNSRKVRMQQGYLSTRPTVRVRIAGEKAFLTVKGKKKGISRDEFEFPVPKKDAVQMLSLCSGSIIDKYRWYVRFSGKLWEVDEFLGENKGLVVAEIELPSENEKFTKPSWIGKEVTHKKQYTNASLSIKPYKHWNN